MSTLVLAGRYEILEKIGDGGMAVVYKARDRQLNRFVAIKILKKEFIADKTFVENFIKEAKAAASLLHPNIVTIHDAGKDRDIYYIVMEYIEGRPLSDVIAAEAPLDYKRCIRIAKQIASALSLAHRNNIVHRDVKPHNILMTVDGTAKITDFGIAKAVSDGTLVNDSGVVMGSVHYFSPEQSRGQYVDEKSDIYSLGIVLYEMITGRVPFDADNPVTIAVMHMNDSIIPPSRLVKGVPPGLDQIVLKATAKFQSDRFHNIDEMYKALDNVNFITGIIDDPEVAGFVKPTERGVQELGRGYSNMAPPEEPAYYDEGALAKYEDSGAPDYRTEYDGRPEEEYPLVYEDEEYAEKPRRVGLFAGLFGGAVKLTNTQKWIIIIAAVAVAVGLSFPLSKVIMGFFQTEPVQVPNVIGMYQDEATSLLESAGFVADIQTVALPAPAVTTAPVATDDTTDLTDQLNLDLPTDTTTSTDPTWQVGQVMDQSPAGGEMVKAGSHVRLQIAGEPDTSVSTDNSGDQLSTELAEVPDLVGKTKSSAEYAISSAGFGVGVVTYENSDSPVDTVIAQSPKKGEQAPGNSKINIVISLGPQANMTTVPNMIGQTLDDAISAASSGKFKLNVTQIAKSGIADNTVYQQDPVGGSQIKEGDTVNVTVNPASTVTSIKISSGQSSMNPGGSYQFAATVTGSGSFSQDVLWSISGNNSGSTKISTTGQLIIGSDETSEAITVTAKSKADSSKADSFIVAVNQPTKFTVTFYDSDGATVLLTVTVQQGQSASPPAPTKDGYTLSWNGNYKNVQQNENVTAVWTAVPPTKYSVTVNGGTGGGNYEAGTPVSVSATVPSGKQFDHWEVSGVSVDQSNPSVSFSMPAGPVTLTANFSDIPTDPGDGETTTGTGTEGA